MVMVEMVVAVPWVVMEVKADHMMEQLEMENQATTLAAAEVAVMTLGILVQVKMVW
jgi:hypothetical protein